MFKDQGNKKQYRRDEDRLFNQVLRVRGCLPLSFKKKTKRGTVYSRFSFPHSEDYPPLGELLGAGGVGSAAVLGGGEVECWEVSVKRDLIHRQKRPTIIASVSKET